MALSEKGKKGVKVIAAIVAATLIFVFWGDISSKFGFLTKKVGSVQELEQNDFETDALLNGEVRETADYTIPAIPIPTDRRIPKPKYVLNHQGIMWAASLSFTGANGGEYTTKNSLFEKLGTEYGKPFMIKAGRQDDYAEQQKALAESLKGYLESKGQDQKKPGTNLGNGAALVSFMGDNSEVYLSQANAALDVVSAEYGYKPGAIRAVAFVISGWSDGEDKAMGLAEWSSAFGGNPENALGEVFACYPQDGDQNLIIKWAVDNGLKINPDGSTYCKDAVNFLFVDGFMEAAQAWGTMTDERMVVTIDESGVTKKTGEKHAHVVHGVGTWLPGDELAFDNAKKAGMDLVSLYSTHDNRHQMPCTLVTYSIAMDEHPEIFDAITEGVVRFGDQVKVHQPLFDFGMKSLADVFKAKPESYWKKYFGGVMVKTVNGYPVRLGGTRAANLSDNMDAFGVGENARGTFKSSYELFGGFMAKLYPDFLPKRLAFSQAVNMSSLERVAAKMQSSGEITERSKTNFGTGEIATKVSERSYAIEFNTGSATFTASGVKALEAMFNDLNTHELRLSISGHTDNTGSDEVNIPLSKKRAEAVVNWLKSKSPQSFPVQRFSEINGYGSTRPLPGIDFNSTAGRSKNRRVEVIVGN